MNQFLSREPFDLHGLHLFALVAQTGSFTRAAEKAGLTQSAVSRQIKGMENRLGTPLFERTTRSVRLTGAGAYLLEEATRITSALDHSLRTLSDRFTAAPKVLRIGISQTIGLSHLPGFFHAFRRDHQNVRIAAEFDASDRLFDKLLSNKLDLVLATLPRRLPRGMTLRHQFMDDFCLILPESVCLPEPIKKPSLTLHELGELATTQRWLSISSQTETGRQLTAWLGKNDLSITAEMETTSFDQIINFVGLGLGVSLVPNRAVPLYLHRRKLRRLPLSPRFTRQIAVLTRSDLQIPDHIQSFIDGMVF